MNTKTRRVGIGVGASLLLAVSSGCSGLQDDFNTTPDHHAPAPLPPPPAQQDEQEAGDNPSTMLNSLAVSDGRPVDGYDRDQFEHWTSEDGCDTRAEVLERDSDGPVNKTQSCTVKTGEWTSPYTGEEITQASDLQIDHIVPLREAWDSGAHRWSAYERQQFANDMDNPQLVAVDSFSNQQKSASDPAEWMPQVNECEYVDYWIDVKFTWGLEVDPAEWHALDDALNSCDSSNEDD